MMICKHYAASVSHANRNMLNMTDHLLACVQARDKGSARWEQLDTEDMAVTHDSSA